MRVHLALAAVAMLAGCQLSMPGRGGDAAVESGPIVGAAIETTRLTPAGGAAATAPETAAPLAGRPRPRPERATPAAGAAPTGAAVAPSIAGATATPPATPPVPEVLKTPQQLACEKRGGAWMAVGQGQARACVKRTRDAGRKCDTKSDCQGQCLARSGTCAPVDPLFGCNEVLENGRRVTICID